MNIKIKKDENIALLKIDCDLAIDLLENDGQCPLAYDCSPSCRFHGFCNENYDIFKQQLLSFLRAALNN